MKKKKLLHKNNKYIFIIINNIQIIFNKLNFHLGEERIQKIQYFFLDLSFSPFF